MTLSYKQFLCNFLIDFKEILAMVLYHVAIQNQIIYTCKNRATELRSLDNASTQMYKLGSIFLDPLVCHI